MVPITKAIESKLKLRKNVMEAVVEAVAVETEELKVAEVALAVNEDLAVVETVDRVAEENADQVVEVTEDLVVEDAMEVTEKEINRFKK